MKLGTLRKVTFMAAVASVSLFLAGMLLGQETTALSKSSQDPAVSGTAREMSRSVGASTISTHMSASPK